MRTTSLVAIATLASASAIPKLPAHAQTLTTLYVFTGGADGCTPDGLIYQAGTLYGTAALCGATRRGTVFAVDPATGAETVINSFNSKTDGINPNGELSYHDGEIYGTASSGGAHFKGLVFKVNLTTGHEKPLYSFQGHSDGEHPLDGVIYRAGTLYGLTTYGGHAGCFGNHAGGCGTVFKVDAKTGAESVLYRFTGGADGSAPIGGVVYAHGNLYGTASGGTGHGTVFAVNPASGAETNLYNFGGQPDGDTPLAGLTYDGRALYGTTLYGGAKGNGAVFKVNSRTGAESVRYSFKGSYKNRGDGAAPRALLVDQSGTLYGTTSTGGGSGCGGSGCGIVFALDPATRSETVLHRFTGPDGNVPTALVYEGGTIYGVTEGGGRGCGSFGCGTVFMLTP
jgi:uncharacterized repeat protein (TIGR03803 family)